MVKNISVWIDRLKIVNEQLEIETNKSKIKQLEKRRSNYISKIKESSSSNESSESLIHDKNPSPIENTHKQNRSIYYCANRYDYKNDEILLALKQSIEQYYSKGVRSSAKLVPLHSFINCIVNHKLKSLNPDIHKNITIFSHPEKEIRVHGMIYSKNVDVTVKYKSHNIGLISIKFIMSNYSQNNINYLETMLGECANLKTSSKRVFWHPIFIFNKIPYFNKNNLIERNESIKLNKYNKLVKAIQKTRNTHNLLPDFVSITILNNVEDLVHPNQLDHNISRFVNNLFDDKQPIIANDDHFGFFENLTDFCKTIIDNISNISASVSSSVSSSISKT